MGLGHFGFEGPVEQEGQHADGNVCSHLCIRGVPRRPNIELALDCLEVLFYSIFRTVQVKQPSGGVLEVRVRSDEIETIVSSSAGPVCLIASHFDAVVSCLPDLGFPQFDVECAGELEFPKFSRYLGQDAGSFAAAAPRAQLVIELPEPCVPLRLPLEGVVPLFKESFRIENGDEAHGQQPHLVVPN